MAPSGSFSHMFSADAKILVYARKQGARVRLLEVPSRGGHERLLGQ